MPLSITIFLLLASFAVLLWSADQFVDSALKIAEKLRLSATVVGVTLVAFGTSVPELAISANAALAGRSVMAVGNALGSNLINMGVVLGLTALISSLRAPRGMIFRELPLLLGSTLLAGVLLFDERISRAEGALSLAVLLAAVLWLATGREPAAEKVPADVVAGSGAWRHWLRFLGFLLLLLISAQFLVQQAVLLSQYLGLSELVIGLTVLAIGSSLPELLTAVFAFTRGAKGLAIGTVIGSNIFNICGVMGLAAVITPLMDLEDTLLRRDYLLVLVMTICVVAVLMLQYRLRPEHDRLLGRCTGVLLLSMYGIYCYALYMAES